MSGDPTDDGLKVGTVMVLNNGGWSLARSLVKIDRLTKTQIVVGTRRFRRLKAWGGTYHEIGQYARSSLTVATPELIPEVKAEHRRAHLLREIEAVKFNKLTDEQLEAIAAALPPTPERSA
jgi:hypothetical protein